MLHLYILKLLRYRGRRAHLIALCVCLLAGGLSLTTYGVLQTHGARAETRKTEKPFTIVVLPDTQLYTKHHPHIFSVQTDWIARNATARNIVFVTHLGDIVDSLDESQWQTASDALAKLDGKVPYGIAPGNHDLDVAGSADMFNKYFPTSRLSNSRYWGGSFSDSGETGQAGGLSGKNSYHLFSTSGIDFIAFNLEFCPPESVVDWVDELLKKHAARKAIIATHSFTRGDGERQDNTMCEEYHSQGTYAGAELWEALVERGGHTNIILTLSGHDIWNQTGGARRTDWVRGKPVHQLLSNYQQFGEGGDGYLRLMTFRPHENSIDVQTYSPYLDSYLIDPANQFSLPL